MYLCYHVKQSGIIMAFLRRPRHYYWMAPPSLLLFGILVVILIIFSMVSKLSNLDGGCPACPSCEKSQPLQMPCLSLPLVIKPSYPKEMIGEKTIGEEELDMWYNSNSNLFSDSHKEWGWLTEKMKSDQCVMLDIGANVGIFAHGLLRLFPQVDVISFEPIPKYAEFIRRHPLSSSRRLKVETMAMGREASPTNLTLLMDKKNLGWNTLHTSSAVIECVECMQPIEITSMSFDYYYQHQLAPIMMKQVSFIKIDTEGYESRVLEGMHAFLMRQALAKQLPLMLIEVAWGPSKHPNWMEEVAQFEWLISLGYHRPRYEVSSTSDVWFVPLTAWN